MTTKRSWIFVFIAIIIASGILMACKQSSHKPIAGATAFEIPEVEMRAVKERALAGDCHAAERIGRHHLFFTLNEPEMIKWFRVAARCPDAQVKAALVNILLTSSKSAEVADEVDNLLGEIRKLDPSFASEFQPTVDRLRRRTKD